MGAKKNFVIDTNVILHDYNCLKNHIRINHKIFLCSHTR